MSKLIFNVHLTNIHSFSSKIHLGLARIFRMRLGKLARVVASDADILWARHVLLSHGTSLMNVCVGGYQSGGLLLKLISFITLSSLPSLA